MLPRLLLGLFVFALLAVVGWNFGFAELPVMMALQNDARNKPVALVAYYRWGVMPRHLVLDLWKTNPDKASMLDVDRVVFQSAEALNKFDFERVIFAYRGAPRYFMNGSDFKEIGETYSSENPIYLLRTMPEKIHSADGAQAFNTWTGGWLGVLNKQLEDHEELHLDWYLRAELNGAAVPAQPDLDTNTALSIPATQ